MSEMKTFAEMTLQERKEFAEEQPKILTKLMREEGKKRSILLIASKKPKNLTEEDIKTLLKECADDKYYPNDSDDDGENEFADNAFSNDSENEYADEESSKKEWDMTYTNLIFFIFGYIQLNEIDFGDKQQNFIQYCYYKMRECDDKCGDCNKTLKKYPTNYEGKVDKDDYEAFWCLYKQIEGAWDTFCLHTENNNIEIPPNFNYSQVFYDEKYGVINPK